MPIVDISGLSAGEAPQKQQIRTRIQLLFHTKFGIPHSSTAVTFIEDATLGNELSNHVMARLYSKIFKTMDQATTENVCDEVVDILEKEAGHAYNEAFPIPILAMRGRENTRQRA